MWILFFSFILINCHKRDEQNILLSETDMFEEKDQILYIDSYHESLPWTVGITKGIQSQLTESSCNLSIIHMDTKRNQSEEFRQNAALSVLNRIKELEPDIIIASDDNASKYVIQPYIMDTGIPVVFCGINWDASVYGFPTEHITGMVEVILIQQLVDELGQFTQDRRIGFIKGNSTTAVKEGENFEKVLDTPIIKRYANNFEEWKQYFMELQDSVDILLVGYPASLTDWDEDHEAMKEFMIANTRTLTGAWDLWLADMVLLTYANQAEEQGEWAAIQAKKILKGTLPSEIPVSRNKRVSIHLNMTLVRNLKVPFPSDFIQGVHLTE